MRIYDRLPLAPILRDRLAERNLLQIVKKLLRSDRKVVRECPGVLLLSLCTQHVNALRQGSCGRPKSGIFFRCEVSFHLPPPGYQLPRKALVRMIQLIILEKNYNLKCTFTQLLYEYTAQHTLRRNVAMTGARCIQEQHCHRSATYRNHRSG